MIAVYPQFAASEAASTLLVSIAVIVALAAAGKTATQLSAEEDEDVCAIVEPEFTPIFELAQKARSRRMEGRVPPFLHDLFALFDHTWRLSVVFFPVELLQHGLVVDKSLVAGYKKRYGA